MAPEKGSSGRAAAAAIATPGRSALFRWLWDRYDDLETSRQSAGRANWAAVAELANADGIRTKSGQPVSRAHVRETFLGVAAAAQAAGRQPDTQATQTSQPEPPSPAPKASQRYTFKPASWREPPTGDKK